MPETRRVRNPKTAALLGGLCVMPFVAANTIVANRIEPLFSFIRPGPHTSAFGYFLLAAVLGFIAVGAFMTMRPLFDQSARRGRGSTCSTVPSAHSCWSCS